MQRQKSHAFEMGIEINKIVENVVDTALTRHQQSLRFKPSKILDVVIKVKSVLYMDYSRHDRWLG